jgi:hypothetical protein
MLIIRDEDTRTATLEPSVTPAPGERVVQARRARPRTAVPVHQESTGRQLVEVDRREGTAQSSAAERAVLATKSRIVAERSAKGVPAFAKNAKVVELVTRALKTRGEFFHDGVRSYVFLKDRRVLLPLDAGEQGLELALLEYGLYPNEYVTKQVIDGLRLEGLGKGCRTVVHPFSYYARQRNTLYTYDFAGGIYRVSPLGIDHVDNGSDGVLFTQNPQWKPLDLTFSGPMFDWKSWLLRGIHFSPGPLSEADQRLLFVLWVLALFFPELFPTRVILALIGEKGSGKSSLLRRLGQLLFGPKFNVTALTSKPDDFDAAITTDPFVVADNADDAPKWLPDRLAVAATGGAIKRRMYYTTNQLGEFPICASLAITSRTPNFQREDIAERLLPLNVQRIERFQPESALLSEVQEQRDAIVAAILTDVWRVLGELEREGNTTYATTFRMADFADFILKVAPVVSTREEVHALLERVNSQQLSFAAEDEPLLDLIDRWLEDETHVNPDREITLSTLASELEALAYGQRLPWEPANPKSFGQYFRARKGTLTRLYGMTLRAGHAGSTVVSFHHRRNGDLGDLGEQ